MSLDFLQVSQQVKQLGEKALSHQRDLKTKLAETCALLEDCAAQIEQLQHKVQEVVRNYDQTLRCAVPVNEALNSHHPLPPSTRTGHTDCS